MALKNGKRKLRLTSSDMIFTLFAVLLLLGILLPAGSLLYKRSSERKLCQSVVPLNGMTYDEAFLEEAAKLPGVRSVTPVLEIPVRLRVGDDTMETVWTGVDLSELKMRVRQAEDVPLGSVPALLLGENSLAGLTDRSGRQVSEKRQKELLRDFAQAEWQYCLLSDEAQTNGKAENWKPCRIAGVLTEPADGMYLDYGQARMLAGISAKTENILLTVQGETAYEQALGEFSQTKE